MPSISLPSCSGGRKKSWMLIYTVHAIPFIPYDCLTFSSCPPFHRSTIYGCKLSYLHLQTLHRRSHCLSAACISPYRSLIYCGHPIIRPNCYGLDSTVSTTVYVFMLLFLLPILETLACMQYNKSAWREYPSQVPSLTESPFCQWNKRNMCNKKCRVFSFDVSFPEWKKNLVRKISGEVPVHIASRHLAGGRNVKFLSTKRTKV